MTLYWEKTNKNTMTLYRKKQKHYDVVLKIKKNTNTIMLYWKQEKGKCNDILDFGETTDTKSS